MLIVGKDNKAKIYKKYGDIQDKPRPKREKTIWEIDEIEKKYMVRE
jgi:hypothetical protein